MHLMIKLFNTLEKKIINFSYDKDKYITIYNCWPTTYSKHTSIGNLRSYLFSDVLKRFFHYLWLSTKHVIKITDVDDRIIKEINWDKNILKEYNEKNIKDFQRMLNDVNTLPIDYLPRVTENMKDIIADICVLEKKGYVYESSWSLYLDTTKIKDYWLLLWELNKGWLINAQKRLEDIENNNKRNPNDFCLWKAYIKEEWTVYRESPRWIWRPWWHSQCSTIARKYLWETIDIHWWWMSHIFPHHENERIQSEIITWKKFVNYRLHHEYVIFEDNYCINLDNVKKKGYDPLIVRLFLIKKHYRSKLNFTYDSLNATRQDINKIIKFLLVLDSVENVNSVYENVSIFTKICEDEVLESLGEDMNVGNAIAALFEFINTINTIITNMSVSDVQIIKDFIFKLDNIFGFIKNIYQRHNDSLIIRMKKNGFDSWEMERWIILKGNRDFEGADVIRNNFKKYWIIMESRKWFKPFLYINNII